jgi:hypothetical protein
METALRISSNGDRPGVDSTKNRINVFFIRIEVARVASGKGRRSMRRSTGKIRRLLNSMDTDLEYVMVE